jgi:hypothetical protein
MSDEPSRPKSSRSKSNRPRPTRDPSPREVRKIQPGDWNPRPLGTIQAAGAEFVVSGMWVRREARAVLTVEARPAPGLRVAD